MPQHTEQPNLKTLRYVLYARKSTEDDTRQVRSIDDQIADCQRLAADLGLNVTSIIKETKSAKKPRRRPKFDQMLGDIRAKKYDAILCWHPDRLSRNMLESGTVIDMLDENVLQDIRFHSHQFSNDANGKMLLGMLFVFSKQYSDDLSAKVSRGIKGNLSEGKSSGAPKFGYDRDDKTGLYEPNNLFDLVQEAWQKRAAGESVRAVTKFLIDRGYHRTTKNKRSVPRIIKPQVSSVANMFHDPFYYGLLVQAKQTVDLRDVYYDFQPMVDEETFNQVQSLNYLKSRDVAPKKNTAFYPLRGMVQCAVCNGSRYMLVGKNKTGAGTYVLSYRCDNPTCTRKPRSLRAKHIFNSLYHKLSNFELSDEAYKRYSARLDDLTDEKLIAIKQEVQSRRGALAHTIKELNDRTLNNGLIDPASATYKANEQRITELTNKQIEHEAEIKKLDQKTENPRQIKLSKTEFLNLLKTASAKMEAGSAIGKDALARILFLNLRVDNEKVVDFIWREPFASFVQAVELSSGRQSDTAVEPILLQMYEALLYYQDFKERLAGLRSLVGTLTPSSRVAEKSFLV
jgi:DNA invertase Pin-like site-specific DNA recombinase